MPIIPTVGRNSARVRAVIGSMYAVLIFGSIFMIYPLLMMVSASIGGSDDIYSLNPVPPYLYDLDVLVWKYMWDKYPDGIQQEERYQNYLHALRLWRIQPEEHPYPRFNAEQQVAAPGAREQIEDWAAFKAQLPWRYKEVQFLGPISSLQSETQNLYHAWLHTRYESIDALNEAYGESNRSFDFVMPPYVEAFPETSPAVRVRKWQDWVDFRETLPIPYHRVKLGSGQFQAWVIDAKYVSVNRLNAAWGTDYPSRYDVALSPTVPQHPQQAVDWESFVRQKLDLDLIAVFEAEPEWQRFLRANYGTVDDLNAELGTAYVDFTDFSMPARAPNKPAPRRVWRRFVRHEVPPEKIRIETGETLYRKYLIERYGSLGALDARYHTEYANLRQVQPPCLLTDLDEVLEKKSSLRWFYLSRNYALVGRYMLTQGRAFWNTFVLVIATLAVQLTVNPFAAYALSRFQLSYTYKVLVFMLGTMAFPAAIGMIPNFLLIRDLGLMNTYWALFLPTAANGFFIFLLKGFFDSLPKELFQTAEVEGASSFWIFRNVVFPLSRPIFAVIALTGFNLAYGGFMWAFVVCQDERMWTLMVWLQQFANSAGGGPLMAALTLAGIPTLLVFLFCQRIIIRGIVVPTFK